MIQNQIERYREIGDTNESPPALSSSPGEFTKLFQPLLQQANFLAATNLIYG
jgi:hypothetical protein